MSASPDPKSEARRRRWLSAGETIAILALIVSALGLYNGWRSGETGPTQVVETKPAIPLVLRGEVERGGKSLRLVPVEAAHALDSVRVTLPNGKTIELGGDGEVDSRDFKDALGSDGDRKGSASTAVRVDARYVEAGRDRSSSRSYVLRYRWEGGGLFDDLELKFTGLSRG